LSQRGEPAPRRQVQYFCANGHSIRALFAADVPAPAEWECPKCGLPAGPDPDHPPDPPRATPYKSHLAYVKERRSDEDGAAILAEALAKLRQRRGE
jgi:hypothetical protein